MKRNLLRVLLTASLIQGFIVGVYLGYHLNIGVYDLIIEVAEITFSTLSGLSPSSAEFAKQYLTLLRFFAFLAFILEIAEIVMRILSTGVIGAAVFFIGFIGGVLIVFPSTSIIGVFFIIVAYAIVIAYMNNADANCQ